MPLSKVKSKKQKLRVKGRQDEWDKIPAADKVGKSGRYSFIRPGSNKK